MGTYNRADILRLVEDENVQFIRMQFTDIFGQLKNVAVTASQIGRALDGEIMLDGSSIRISICTRSLTRSPSCPGDRSTVR